MHQSTGPAVPTSPSPTPRPYRLARRPQSPFMLPSAGTHCAYMPDSIRHRILVRHLHFRTVIESVYLSRGICKSNCVFTARVVGGVLCTIKTRTKRTWVEWSVLILCVGRDAIVVSIVRSIWLHNRFDLHFVDNSAFLRVEETKKMQQNICSMWLF